MNKTKKASRAYQEIWPIVDLNRQTLRSSQQLRRKLLKLKRGEVRNLAKELKIPGRSSMKFKDLLHEVAFVAASRYAQAEINRTTPEVPRA